MRKLLPLLVFALLYTPDIAAQQPFFQAYFMLKRNEQVQVNAFLQSRSGFLYIGTGKGLFRFDGMNFKRFVSSDSLLDNDITALAEDSTGTIWAGHRNGQLSRLAKENLKAFVTREGAATAAVSDIIFDRRGTLWYSTLNDGLYYFTEDRLYRLDEQEGLPDLFVYDLFQDDAGNIWAGTDGGIAVCSMRDRKATVRVIGSRDGLPDLIIKKIRKLEGDTISVATEDAGILNYNIKTGAFRPLTGNPWKEGSVSDFVVKGGQVWISMPRRGLAVYDRNTGRMTTYPRAGQQSFLSLTSLMRDVEGNIWLGSKTGLVRTPGDAVQHIEQLDPAEDVNILALTVDKFQRIWFSTSEGLFVRSELADGSFRVEKKLDTSPIHKSNVISMYTDEQGQVWAGLYGAGLLRIDPVTFRTRHFDSELSNGNVLNITGRGNTVVVATLGGGTSVTYSGDEYTFRNFSAAGGLSSDFTYQVFIDSRNRTWFATDGRGVTMVDDAGFHHYSEGLPSRVVYSIAEDAAHNIWVTSQDNGIFRLEGNRFVAPDGIVLRDNSVQSLVTDRHGNLIAIHDYGLDVYDGTQQQMRYWGEESGIRDKSPNLNAVARDGHGHLYIGTSHGIIKFSLDNDRSMSRPKPAVDAVRVHDDYIDISAPPALSYDENNVTLQYVGLWFQNSANLNYQYKLENYDREWIPSRDRSVTYSRLPPGDYVFRVMVSETEDFGNAEAQSLAFSILPPFWQTPPFYVIAVALLLIAMYSFLTFRERRLLREKHILEGKVRERTLEIQRKTEEIQAQNEEITAQAEEIQGINENLEMLVKQRTAELEKKNKALEEYAFINAHKLRSPVASILGLLDLFARSDTKEDAGEIREHLHQSARKLDEVVRSIARTIEDADDEYTA